MQGFEKKSRHSTPASKCPQNVVVLSQLSGIRKRKLLNPNHPDRRQNIFDCSLFNAYTFQTSDENLFKIVLSNIANSKKHE